MNLFGFPVFVHPLHVAVSALMAVSARRTGWHIFEWVGVVFVSVLVHELGHAFVARAYGLSPVITLHAMGGLTSFEGSRRVRLRRRDQVAISLGGPFAGLLLGALVWFATTRGFFGHSALGLLLASDLIVVNIAWSLMNLLPMLPLDGGHVMEQVVSFFTPRRIWALGISVFVSLGVFGLALAWGLAWNLVFIALMVLPVFQEFWAHVSVPRHRPVVVDPETLVATQHARLARGDEVDTAVLERIARNDASPELRRKAACVLAAAHLFADRGIDALAALALIPEPAQRPSELVAEALVASGGPEQALARAQEAVDTTPAPHTASVLLAVVRLTRHFELAPGVISRLGALASANDVALLEAAAREAAAPGEAPTTG